ncbi:hypothetical protein DNJ73_06445 [Prochlorococcus marinus XMU1408]|uniref:Uncharacterized protein n=1 Tax=Prochlorococcus marinus XMU1408 TaxID=2213228 RepID=A0A318R6P2_PROMR|nr:hypothetical protein DNJ73_06445 [Prochlorococcus marinus XMU1408]
MSLIAITGCSIKSNKTSEIIKAPTFPKDFSDIPSMIEESGLKELKSSNTFIKSIPTGRNDPFLPPSRQSVKPRIPKSFKFLGFISTGKSISAFVSFNNESGTIKKGDIGGKTTKLLPNGWLVSDLNKSSQLLKLSFKNSESILKLMPERNYDIKIIR